MYEPFVKNCPLQAVGGQFCIITITIRITIRYIVKILLEASKSKCAKVAQVASASKEQTVNGLATLRGARHLQDTGE